MNKSLDITEIEDFKNLKNSIPIYYMRNLRNK